MDFGVELFFYLFFAHLVIVGLSFPLALAKGYNATNWSLVCLLTGILGLIVIIGMPDLKQRKYLRFIAEKAGLEPGD